MDIAEYHRHPAISKSHLDQVARSPLHYWARYVDPNRVEPEPTAAMTLGTAVHTALLEPQDFMSNFVQSIEVDRRTKDGKARWAEFEAEVAEKNAIVLSPADWRLCHSLADACRSHPAAGRLLEKPGTAEATTFWTDAKTGLDCKCRPDWLTEDGWILDIKTTEDASPSAFARSVANYRYYVQAAWYLAGVKEDGLVDPKGFIFLAIEKRPPYAVAVYAADEEMIAAGYAQARENLAQIAECRQLDLWPGYGNEIRMISLPAWATRTSEAAYSV